MGPLINVLAGFMAAVTIVQGVFTAAIGYVIELIAKIEWNTRPANAETGYVAGPGAGSGSMMTGKQYFIGDKGKVSGPFTAPEMLNLYRDGKLSNAAQPFVEENGQRRPLANWSEIFR